MSAGPRLPHFALVKLLAEAASLEHATPRFIELIAGAFGWSAGALWLADADDRLLVWSDGWASTSSAAGPSGGCATPRRTRRRSSPARWTASC